MVRPLMGVIPEVAPPERRVNFRDRLLWTGIALLIFLVCSQMPIYGIKYASTADPFYYMRVILASNRGTLMELGISPIVTSGLVLQLLVGSRVIQMDYSVKEDRNLYAGAQKLLALLTTLGMAVVYVMSGMYGNVSTIGTGNAILIITQLFLGGVIVLMLDELLQKGYGLGSGINLFVATNVCENVVWAAFSPTTITTGRGTEFQGAVIAFFHLLVTRKNKIQALKEALYRQNLPNICNLLATVLVFLTVVFFQGWRVNLTVKYQKYRGQEAPYPIKLFYTGNMPIILQTALVSNIYFVSQLFYSNAPGNPLVQLLGEWQTQPGTGNLIPVGGIAYYISPPNSFSEILYDPFRAVFYLVFLLTACAIFSRAWMEVSNKSPRDVAKQFRDQQMTIKGYRESGVIRVLSRYIPTSAALGGMIIGAITVFADFLGCVGTGTGILLAVTIVYGYYEEFAMERKQMMSQFGM